MRIIGFIALALLPVPAAAVQDGEIIVRADRARIEIERILDADNLDTGRLPAREVADAMADIPRGDAPADFWAAYQAHLQAWQWLARAEAGMARRDTGALIDELDAIDATFDEVERLALRYSARMPIPRSRLSSIV